MAKSEVKNPTELPVEFGGVSIGDDTARLGLKLDRKNLTLSSADKLFSGCRLTIRAVLTPSTEAEGQKPLKGFEERNLELEAVVDVKRFGVGPKAYTAGLTFQVKGLDVSTLSKFAKRSGKLVIVSVQEIPEDKAGDEEDEE